MTNENITEPHGNVNREPYEYAQDLPRVGAEWFDRALIDRYSPAACTAASPAHSP
jgi:hypothetical protein